MSCLPVARALAALLTLAACAAPLPHLPKLDLDPVLTDSRASYVLTAADLPPEQYRSLRDAVEHKWPDLGSDAALRGAQWSPSTVLTTRDRFAVYDSHGAFLGGPDALDGVLVSAVSRLRRLTAIEEYIAFGTRHPAGALIVTWAPGFRR